MRKNDKNTLVPKLRFPEFMGAWERKKLKSLLIEARLGGNYENSESNEGIPLIKMGNIDRGTINIKKIQFLPDGLEYSKEDFLNKGDILFNTRNTLELVGKVAIWRNELDKAIYNSNLLRLKFNNELEQSNRFANYMFNTGITIKNIRALATGTTSVAAIYDRDLKNLEFFYPSPNEQQKIADCLTSLDDLITAEAGKLEAYKAHKKGLMQKLFPAEGETVPEWRFPEFRDSGEWEIKAVGEICEVLQGFGFPESIQGKRKGKYPFCKVSDISKAVIENGGFLSKSVNYIDDNDLMTLKAKLIPRGSTVFAKIGEALRLNRRAFSIIECLIDNNAAALKSKKNIAEDYYIFSLSQLIDLGKHCGGAVPSVNKTTLQTIEISIPSLSEQQKIADCLSSLDELITTQSQKIEALKKHKKSMMQQLFPANEENNSHGDTETRRKNNE